VVDRHQGEHGLFCGKEDECHVVRGDRDASRNGYGLPEKKQGVSDLLF
jgi:hypothetical protein